jgi:hypothetical protein
MTRFLRSRAFRAAAVSVGLVTMVGVGIAAPAGAQPPSGYGFDNTGHNLTGGGSDTTYLAQIGLSDLWLKSSLGNACSANTGTVGPYPLLNSCVASATPDTNTLGNWQHDTIAQAGPVGSSAGIASLNNSPVGISYGGAANGSGLNVGPNCAKAGSPACGTPPVNVDFARSSRTAKLSGGSCALGVAPNANDELACDTFWGYASDGLTVAAFNRRGTQLSADATGLTAAEIFHIYNCDFHFWSDVPSLGITAGAANDGPIVAWGMNSSSGTYATMNSYLISQGGAPSGFLADAQPCVHKLTNGTYPLENDIKPILDDVQAHGMLAAAPQPACGPGMTADANSTYTGGGPPLVAVAADVCHPDNFVMWGSFGVFSAFPYTSSYTQAAYGTNEALGFAAQILTTGVVSGPSGSNILAATWPNFRILFHVTRKVDADCAVRAARTVTDGATTIASVTVTSATAGFDARDLGSTVTGAGIPAGATIVAINSPTSVNLSAAATATATGVSLTFTVQPFGTAANPRPCSFANNVGKDSAGGVTASPGPAIGSGANACAGGVLGANCDLNVVSGDSTGVAPNSPGNSTGAGTGSLGGLGTRNVADGATTAGSANVCSPSGGFGAADVGQYISGGGLYPNSYASAFIASGGACGAAPANGVTVTIPANAAAAGSASPVNIVVSGGPSGAVREYTRFLCRVNTTQQDKNPTTGVNLDTDITTAIHTAGFQVVPLSKRTFGSRCAVTS